ncbi:hypothetical protein [Maribacter arenosus]|uniref:Lipoprotein n=1 Tax=Maribacter arenosus TaxID=1854708 RepID=A0ABR7V8Z3_9FLAO|nr:hypothetical protein [Maribacter arenosus]MBD0850134.1 hypothetical protein [Maribacter arenosus]
MKKTAVIMAAILSLVISCKETNKENPAEEKTKVETIDYESHSTMFHEPNETWVNEIMLNNGLKWSANTETTDGVREMLILIEDNKTTTTVDYKNLGVALNNVKNMVVKECTMKGASHDNLHVWLHPLIDKIALLQKVENPEEGSQLTSSIQEHLEAYYDYFE